MVQGIMGLNTAQPQQAEGASPDAVNALSGGFNSLSPAEINSLQELQDDLSELSPDKLQILQQIIQFLKKNQDRYDDAVRMLVDKGVIEAGDLPPDYVPSFFEILEKMVDQALSGGREQFAKGGIAALRKKAKAVQKAGTGSDKILAHINPREAAMLQATRGGGMNPKTGLPEYGFFDDIGNFLKKAAPVWYWCNDQRRIARRSTSVRFDRRRDRCCIQRGTRRDERQGLYGRRPRWSSGRFFKSLCQSVVRIYAFADNNTHGCHQGSKRDGSSNNNCVFNPQYVCGRR